MYKALASKSGRQGTRAAEPYKNGRVSDQPPEERARTDPAIRAILIRFYASESDVYSRQILPYKDGPSAGRVNATVKDRV